MKKLAVLCLIAGVCVLFASASAQQMVNPKAEFLKSAERGKALFNDPSIGTTGQSCSNCHIDGGTKTEKVGKMEMKAFNRERDKFPKYSMSVGRVVTLDQIINWCVIGPMKGTAFAWDDQRLTDLVSYVSTVKPEMPQKEAVPPTTKEAPTPK
jgi:cytochrome c553